MSLFVLYPQTYSEHQRRPTVATPIRNKPITKRISATRPNLSQWLLEKSISIPNAITKSWLRIFLFFSTRLLARNICIIYQLSKQISSNFSLNFRKKNGCEIIFWNLCCKSILQIPVSPPLSTLIYYGYLGIGRIPSHYATLEPCCQCFTKCFCRTAAEVKSSFTECWIIQHIHSLGNILLQPHNSACHVR